MTDLMPQAEPSGFYGPYRGVVTNTQDPAGQNRIKAIVPQLFGNTTTETDWALPCQLPGLQAVPPPGQGVWIMFEGGDLNYPVFMGMWQPEPSVAPYEVAGAGASAVGQAVAEAVSQSEAFSTAALNAYVPLSGNPAGRMVGITQNVWNNSFLQITSLTTDFFVGGMARFGDTMIIPVTGVYTISVSLCFENGGGAPAQGYYETQVHQNGVQTRTYRGWAGSLNPAAIQVGGSDLIHCSALDVLTLYGFISNGSTNTGVCLNAAGQGATNNYISVVLESE